MSHTINIWERVIESRITSETNISIKQFSFMPRRSIVKILFVKIMENYQDKKKDLHMAFIKLKTCCGL